MNRDKVLELAQQCQLVGMRPHLDGIYEQSLQQFAALIEREVCGGMSRDKVFELMLAAGCSKYCDPKHPELEGFIVNDSVLDRIVALIEREVRGDAEPVACIATNGALMWLKKPEALYSKPVPLFMHPAPAVTCESVDVPAYIKLLTGRLNDAQDEIQRLLCALENATKERGL